MKDKKSGRITIEDAQYKLEEMSLIINGWILSLEDEEDSNKLLSKKRSEKITSLYETARKLK